MSPRFHHYTIFFARVLTLLYAIAICVLSLVPGRDVPMGNVSDKYRHAAAYGVFAVLLGCSFLRLRFAAVALAFVLASLVGVAMELIQPSFGRSKDAYDALANAVGAAMGCAVLAVLLPFVPKRPAPFRTFR